jgi:hypothetical protein
MELRVDQDTVVIDKVVSSIVISEEESKELVSVVGARGKRNNNGTMVVLRTEEMGMEGTLFIVETVASIGIRVVATWNPQTTFSKQNTLLAVGKDGEFIRDSYYLAERPFKKLVEKMPPGLAEKIRSKQVLWNRLDLATYTPELGGVNLMGWLARAYEPIFRRAQDDKTLGAAICLNTEFTKYSRGDGSITGLRWIKVAGSHKVYTLTMYRKDVSANKRLAGLEGASREVSSYEMLVARKNVAGLSKVGDRVRVELQLYPDTFFRGKAAASRKILGVGKEGAERLREAQIVEKITPEVAKALFRLVVEDLGIRLVLRAPSKKYLVSRMLGLGKREDLVAKWGDGEKVSKKNSNNAKWGSFVRANLGFNPCEVNLELFVWIRRALEESMLAYEDNLKEDWNTVGLAKARKLFLERRQEIRSIGWLKTFLFRE